MSTLTSADVHHLGIGANFLACHVDPTSIYIYEDMIQHAIATHSVALIPVGELQPDDLVVSVGIVSQGLLIADMPPVGDEFTGCLQALEARLKKKVRAVFPLAASNVNGILPLLVGIQAGLPVVDSDPMGRIFPLINQTTLNMGNVGIGPIAVRGVTGEQALVEVEDPYRAETLVRALVLELGGWAATAMYPCTAQQLSEHGVHGSVTRMIGIGEILAGQGSAESKFLRLVELLHATRIARARVSHKESFSWEKGLGLPTQTTSLTLIDETTGQIIRLEIQNEILLVLVDGAVAAAIPDIITLLSTEHGNVVNLDDVREGDVLDIIMTPAAPQWYSDAGLKLAGPAAFNLPVDHPRRHA